MQHVPHLVVQSGEVAASGRVPVERGVWLLVFGILCGQMLGRFV